MASEQITLRGVGNGISLIIFRAVAEIPRALASTLELEELDNCRNDCWDFCLSNLTVLFIVFFERAMRKI